MRFYRVYAKDCWRPKTYVSGPLELGLQLILICYLGAGNLNQVLCKSDKY